MGKPLWHRRSNDFPLEKEREKEKNHFLLRKQGARKHLRGFSTNKRRKNWWSLIKGGFHPFFLVAISGWKTMEEELHTKVGLLSAVGSLVGSQGPYWTTIREGHETRIGFAQCQGCLVGFRFSAFDDCWLVLFFFGKKCPRIALLSSSKSLTAWFHDRKICWARKRSFARPLTVWFVRQAERLNFGEKMGTFCIKTHL